MKSGLEDRNNALQLGQHPRYGAGVSMKSGLEDRNNAAEVSIPPELLGLSQ